MSFDAEFNQIVMVEGGYSNHPSDSGGKTRYGITEAVARKHGYVGPMDQLPLTVAKTIYRKDYWEALRLDDVEKVSSASAHELFDTGVNCGVGVAGEYLQRALENFNRRGKDYPDVVVDGAVGDKTIAALKSYFAVRGTKAERVLLRALNAQQGTHYLRLGDRPDSDKNEDFMFGWFDNRVVI